MGASRIGGLQDTPAVSINNGRTLKGSAAAKNFCPKESRSCSRLPLASSRVRSSTMPLREDSKPYEMRTEFEATALPLMKAVYTMALRLTRRDEEARDLVQETYLRAYRTFGNFRPGTNCRAWLFTILYSIFVNRYRKRQREPHVISIEELEEKFHRSVEAHDSGDLSAAERVGSLVWTDREVEAALDALPEDFRATVLLVDVEELSYEEAAAALDCPVGTVRSRLSRARKHLFVRLREHARRGGYSPGKAQTEP